MDPKMGSVLLKDGRRLTSYFAIPLHLASVCSFLQAGNRTLTHDLCGIAFLGQLAAATINKPTVSAFWEHFSNAILSHPGPDFQHSCWKFVVSFSKR